MQPFSSSRVFRSLSTALGLSLALASPLGAQDAMPEETLVETKLVAQEALDGDNFGAAVAVDGDLMVVAAPWADIDGVDRSGAVYLFERDLDSGQWLEQQRLMPDDGNYDSTAMSLAIEGDTIVVGAFYATFDVFQEGAVYVFERDDAGAWPQVTKLTDPSVGFAGHYGISVALAGDLLAVGADMQPTSNGKVTLFERDRGGPDSWGEVTTLYDSVIGDGGALEAFGSAVVIAGDLLLVGAERADVSAVGENDGAAYLFRRGEADPDQWDYVTRLVAPESDDCVGGLTIIEFLADPESDLDEMDQCRRDSKSDHDNFGGAVAFDGDTIVVGASSAEGDDGSYSVGAAHVFEPDPDEADAWHHVAKLTTSDVTRYLGGDLALTGDTIVVGAHGTTIGSRDSQGAAYVFERDPDGAWHQTEKLIAFDGLSSTYFGDAVALDGNTRVIGAWGDTASRGAVYVHAPAALPDEPGEPEFPPTADLTDDGLAEDASGVLLGAVDGTLSEPLAVWVHQVETPSEALPALATPHGAFYNVGATATTSAAAEGTFALSLPVPETIDTAHLGIAILLPASRRLGDAATADPWQPISGDLDPDLRLLSIPLRTLFAEGMTVVLIEHPDLAPLPPLDTAMAPARSADEAVEEPVFSVECYDWDEDACGEDDEAIFADALKTAYDHFAAIGYTDPALESRRLTVEQEGGRPRRHRKVVPEVLTYLGNRVRDGTKPYCADLVGRYVPSFQLMEFCYSKNNGGAPNADADSDVALVARHELFHAFQHGFEAFHDDWSERDSSSDPIGIFTNPASIEDFMWVSEGTASAAEDSKATLLRSRTWPRDLHPVSRALTAIDRKTTSGVEKIAYEAQDFWVYFGNKTGLGLDYLKELFALGATPAAADQFFADLHQTSLGQEYWGWVKNQAMEKTYDLNKTLQGPCTIATSLVGEMATLLYPPSDAHAAVEGKLARLTSHVVRIITTRQVGPLTVTASADDGEPGEDFDYKVYLEGEEDCSGVADRERKFEALGGASILYVAISHLRHEPDSTLDYTVSVTDEDEQLH